MATSCAESPPKLLTAICFYWFDRPLIKRRSRGSGVSGATRTSNSVSSRSKRQGIRDVGHHAEATEGAANVLKLDPERDRSGTGAFARQAEPDLYPRHSQGRPHGLRISDSATAMAGNKAVSRFASRQARRREGFRASHHFPQLLPRLP
jgi:hypothetical protein